MFDIGFWEIGIIGVIALLVIGPERLPAVARTVGLWISKAKGFVQAVQSDVKKEINKTEELKNLIEKQSQIKEMHEIIEQTVDDVRATVSVNANLSESEESPKSIKDQKSKKLDETNASSNSPSNSTPGSKTETNHKPSSKNTPTSDAVNDQVK
jgi:sec-independent protein translocase protein TatB